MNDHQHLFHSTENHDLHQHTVDGEHIAMSTKNVFGGETFIKDGRVIAESHANIQGGYDVYHGTTQVLHTEQNIFGGQDVHHGSDFIGHTAANSHGGNDFIHHGFPEVSSIPLGHGFTSVMVHDDPLLHTADYHVPELDLLAADVFPH
ncbi:MAG: hypothetical protein ACJ74Y_11180 [Bryobacteraceae bacterium]